jgi:threonine 3-dehydrogenase
MKALVKEKPEPGIAYRDVPDPSLKPGHVIVRVKACGISGSEVRLALYSRHKRLAA